MPRSPRLLVCNVVLGPVAVVLAARALAGGTVRRGRAILGFTLGVACVVVFAALAMGDATAYWHLGA